MYKDQLTKISITAEVPSFDLIWISKLFAIIDESHIMAFQDGSEAGKKLNEIKELVNKYQLKKDSH